MNSLSKKKKKNLSLAEWNQLAELLERYDALEPSRLSSFLIQARIAHPELAEELFEAISEKQQVAGFLDKGPGAKFRNELEREKTVSRSQPGEVGKEIGKYRILEKIKSGGMAEIYRAQLMGANRFAKTVAIKKILPQYVSDPQVKLLFEQEASICGQLNHANIAHTYDFFSTPEGMYLVMEFIPGKNLREILVALKEQKKRLSPGIAVFIIREVCKALEFAHSKKNEQGVPLEIVHRDVSPQNIMVSSDGAVKLVDFGIAKALGTIKTASGVRKGKFGYMPPEQANGLDMDRRTDIYALGLVLYELLCGKPALQAKNDLEVYTRAKAGKLAPFPAAVAAESPALVPVLTKALQIKPERRYQTAKEMGQALNGLKLGASVFLLEKDLGKMMEQLFPG